MMPFYYGAKVRSVPEYLRLRFNDATHLFNAGSFAVAMVLIAGVNLYALALVVHLLLGWQTWVSIVVAAGFVLCYITLGGLSSAIYNEVLQFFIICASLIPLTVIGLSTVGGWDGLKAKVTGSDLGDQGVHAWQGLANAHTNSIGASWIAIVFGLGFVLSFGYWTTNFTEVQRALSAKNMNAARRTPLIAAYPKLLIPAVTVIPGLVALVTVKGLGGAGDLQYNNAIPFLMEKYLPSGVLGIAITGLLAAFMSGMAANVTAFNTVVTYDLWQAYVKKDEEDAYYLRFGRLITVVGVLIAVGTAFIAAGFSNIMNYIQLLFSFFNAPLFATFIIAMFWRRSTPWAGFWGLVAGTLGAFVTHMLYAGFSPLGIGQIWHFNTDLAASFWGAIVAFLACAVVTVGVSLVTEPKPEEELRGLVWGLDRKEKDQSRMERGEGGWWRSPALLGGVALAGTVILNLLFL
jgi:SSS family solute:Na+ symporter